MQQFKNFLIFIKDFFVYPFVSIKSENRFHRLLDFLFKEYPAFFEQKPSIWRAVMLPWLIWYTITREEKW